MRSHNKRTPSLAVNPSVYSTLQRGVSFLRTKFDTVKGFAIHCIDTSIYRAIVYYRVIV